MKKWLAGFGFLIILSLFLSACGGSSQTGSDQNASGTSTSDSKNQKASENQGASEKVTIKMGVPGSQTHPFTIGAKKFKEILNKISNGTIDVQIFPNSQLGGERAMAESVRQGTLDMTCVTVDGAMPNWVPEGQVFSIPYLIQKRKTAYKVLSGDVGQILTKKVKEKGFINLGYWELGFRNFTNNVRPIKGPDDMKDMKIRVQESPVWVAFIKSVGASPTPISFDELYTALSQGVVDGEENPLPTIYSQKFYEVQKYLTLDRHTYTPAYVLISPKTWKSLSDQQQKWIQEAVNKTTPYQRNWVKKKGDSLVKTLEQKGMQIVKNPDIAAFRKATKNVADKISGDVPKTLVQKVINAEP